MTRVLPPDPLDLLADSPPEGEGSADVKEYVSRIAERCIALERSRTPEQSVAVEVMEAEQEEARREIGFSARLLVQATLPHSQPHKEPETGRYPTEFSRSNGYVTIKIISDSRFGLPFGTYPRLLLSWITTEAVRTKNPELTLGNSLRQFMDKLGLTVGGGKEGSTGRLRSHMQRLFTSTVSATYQTKGTWRDFGFRPIEGSAIFWDPQMPNQGSLWQSKLVLNRTFFEEITFRPVPIDLVALREISKQKSPLAIDIYQWLTHRMSYLREPTTIPWETLELQFGGDYKRTIDFKRKFVGHLKKVLAIYKTARIEPGRTGVILRPSSPHVRLLRGR